MRPHSLLTDRARGRHGVQLGMAYDPQPPFDSGSPAGAGPATAALSVKLMTAAMVEAGPPPEQVALLAQAAAAD